MGYKNREVESKHILRGEGLNWVSNTLDLILKDESSVRRHGSSTDHYWAVSPTKFARVRERDGIRQLTVKSKDRGTNANRVEVDLDCTSKLSDIGTFFKTLLGPQSGTVSKSYYVWESNQSEHDTVTAYVVSGHDFLKDCVVLEFEARTQAGVDRLEKLVLDSLTQRGNITIERSPGSLYELLILKETVT